MAVWNPPANDIFLKALEIAEGEERVAYLERACADDPELRHTVDALLTAHEDAGSFLAHPALEPRQDETLPKEAGPPADWVGLVLELLPPSEDPWHLRRAEDRRIQHSGRRRPRLQRRRHDRNPRQRPVCE